MELFKCQWFPSTYLFSLGDSSCLANLAESPCMFCTDSSKLLVFNIELMRSSCLSEISAGCCNKYWAAENRLKSGFQIERWTCLDYVTGRSIFLLIIAAYSEQARRAAWPFFIVTAWIFVVLQLKSGKGCWAGHAIILTGFWLIAVQGSRCFALWVYSLAAWNGWSIKTFKCISCQGPLKSNTA